MSFIQRAKTLWKLGGAHEAAEQLESRVEELTQRTETMVGLLGNLLKTQAEVQQLAEATRREAAAAIQEVKSETSELDKAWAVAADAAEANARTLEEQAETLVANIRGQVEAFWREAKKIDAEIQRLEDAVRGKND